MASLLTVIGAFPFLENFGHMERSSSQETISEFLGQRVSSLGKNLPPLHSIIPDNKNYSVILNN